MKSPAIARLFAEVYADPFGDGPRVVLADALQELGDPRGELIALQLARARTGKRTRRESALIKQHARAWLGPIGPAVPNRDLKFERGFLAKCRIQHHRETIEPYLKHQEWKTVEEVILGRWVGSLQPFADALPALRVLGEIEFGGQVPSHPRLETIRVKYINVKDVEHLATRVLPALRQLDIGWCYAHGAERKPLVTAFGKRMRVLH